jgi:hypothetical protein
MDKNTIVQFLLQAAQDGTLMIPKHDPGDLGTIYTSYRSVLSCELAGHLKEFIESQKYEVTEYENRNYPDSPLYFRIDPYADCGFSVPASGVAANSPSATNALDTLVAVSGKIQGWHLFGEASNEILQKIWSGDLVLRGKLK